jgi:hypothetical protein
VIWKTIHIPSPQHPSNGGDGVDCRDRYQAPDVFAQQPIELVFLHQSPLHLAEGVQRGSGSTPEMEAGKLGCAPRFSAVLGYIPSDAGSAWCTPGLKCSPSSRETCPERSEGWMPQAEKGEGGGSPCPPSELERPERVSAPTYLVAAIPDL